MRLATVANNFNVTLGNSIPLSAWTSVSSATSVSVSSTQALFVIRPQDDGFWGFLFTPNSSSSQPDYTVPANSVYTLFTKPSSFTGTSLSIAFESPVFSEPILLINGAEDYIVSAPSANFSYYKFDVRPYFNL